MAGYGKRYTQEFKDTAIQLALNSEKSTLQTAKEYEIELDEDLPKFFDRTKRYVDYALLNKTGKIIAIVF